jgi:hypothetical protein
MSEKTPERGTLVLDDPQRLLQQAFQVFFNPEIERRREAGLIDTTFGISVAQVVFNEDERWEVRFNEEVDGHIEAVAAVEIDAGQEVLMSMIGEIKAFDLTEDDPNAAHITVFYRGEQDGWLVISDLRFNATLASDHIEAAREFFEAAARALEADATPRVLGEPARSDRVGREGSAPFRPGSGHADSQEPRIHSRRLQPPCEARERRASLRPGLQPTPRVAPEGALPARCVQPSPG